MTNESTPTVPPSANLSARLMSTFRSTKKTRIGTRTVWILANMPIASRNPARKSRDAEILFCMVSREFLTKLNAEVRINIFAGRDAQGKPWGPVMNHPNAINPDVNLPM